LVQAGEGTDVKQSSSATKRILRLLFALALVVQPGGAVLGQSAKPRESRDREQQTQTGLNLLNEVVLKEAEELRLVDNRAYVYKSAAAALAKRRPKQAIQLLERALNEIDTAAATQPVDDAQQQYSLEGLRRVRDEVVLALSEVDPMRALKAMHANKGESDSRTPGDSDLESRVLQKGAAKDPALILERALKDLSDKVSPGLVETCVALREKDPEMGRKLGGAIVERLRSESPDPHSPAAQAAFALMAEIWSRGQETALDTTLLDESSIKQLVAFVADLLLNQPNPPSGGFTGDITAFAGVVDKYAPAKAAQFRSALAKLPAQQLPFGPPDMKELETFLQAQNYDRAADWTRKAPIEAKQYALHRIAQAEIDNGQVDLARDFVSSQITDAGAREELLGRLASVEAEAAADKGDEATAKRLIPMLPSGHERLSTLLSLARKAAESGDRGKASAILDQARALPSDKSEQLTNELVVAEEYLKVDATKAVENLAAHIERLNRLLEAAAVLDGYFASECIQEGELRYLSPSPLLPGIVALCDVLGKIAAVDPEQALQLARRINGRELQTLAILTIARHLILGPDYRSNDIGPLILQTRLAHSSGQEREGL
jgi:hypothetical protein